jgi:hypothetical protein
MRNGLPAMRSARLGCLPGRRLRRPREIRAPRGVRSAGSAVAASAYDFVSFPARNAVSTLAKFVWDGLVFSRPYRNSSGGTTWYTISPTPV